MRSIRYAFRALLRTPTVSAIASLPLVIGIGGNTAIFSVINGLVLRAAGQRSRPSRISQRWSSGGVDSMELCRMGRDSWPAGPLREQRRVVVYSI